MPPFNPRTARRSLLPFLLFISLFLGTGLVLQVRGVEYAFQQLPGHVAILPALILAVFLLRKPADESLSVLMRGAGSENIITMCVIFLLAGAFSSVASASGGVDAVVNAGLQFIPSGFILPGLFVISALVSLAMGTSVGTIGALAPVAVGFAQQTGANPAMLAGALFGGAMFGDNLSVISDTTIAATRTQGVNMKDKFRENIKIALPAAILTTLLFVFLSEEAAALPSDNPNWMAALPYLIILVLAVAGMNVFAVLILGIVMAALQGFFFSGYELGGLGRDIASGFADMQGIFLLAMFVGALGEFIKEQGGLEWISGIINRAAERFSKTGNRARQMAIGLLVFVTDICIANNVVAIVVTGDLNRTIAQEHGISPRRAASLADLFACIGQSFIPYGAQALLLSATFGISPWEAVIHNFYGVILLACSVAAIAVAGVSASGNP